MRVLVVEDDEMIAEGLRFSLMSEDYEVLSAGTVQEAEKIWRSGMRPDFCLLDVMLPGMNGFEACRKIRQNSDIPIFFITARVLEEDELTGYAAGADDYITKPFNILEVKARIKAIIRRNKRKAPAKPEEPKVITSGKLKLDIEAKRLYIEDREIRLTVKEFDILKLLAEIRERYTVESSF